MHDDDWHLIVLAAVSGALGVAGGYAIFLTYQENHSAPGRFLLALLSAVLVSYVIEWLRNAIQGGELRPLKNPFKEALTTLVMLLFFELFISGFHAAAEADPRILRHTVGVLLGEDAMDTGGLWTWCLGAGVWITLGALLAVGLSLWLIRSLGETAADAAPTVVKSAGLGASGAALLAVALVCFYILAGRMVIALQFMMFQYSNKVGGVAALQWLGQAIDRHLPALGLWLSEALENVPWLKTGVELVSMPFSILSRCADVKPVFFCVLCAMLLFLVLARKARRDSVPLFLLWIGCLINVGVPLLFAIARVLLQLADPGTPTVIAGALGLAALVWLVPGALLGALVSVLARASTSRREWAWIGYGGALLLAAPTVLAALTGKAGGWTLLGSVAPIAALTAIALGWMFRRGASVEDYWPLAALCVALAACGATGVRQRLTFTQEVGLLHTIDVLSPEQYYRTTSSPRQANPLVLSASKTAGLGDESQELRPFDAEEALELAISGSVAFWLTAGLLACRKVYERDTTA